MKYGEISGNFGDLYGSSGETLLCDLNPKEMLMQVYYAVNQTSTCHICGRDVP